MSAAVVFGIACAATPDSDVGTAHEAPVEQRTGAGSRDADWTRYEWDSLVLIQQELALGRFERVPTMAVDVAGSELSPAERMWLEIYRGFALDRLARRDAAVAAYRAAQQIHPHTLAKVGLRSPLRGIRHITAMSEIVARGWRFQAGVVQVEGASIRWMALAPETTEARHPALIRVGHPHDERGAAGRIAQLRMIDALPVDTVIVQTDILGSVPAGRKLLVDDRELIAQVPPRFHAATMALVAELPIDPHRIYLTGFSFDGVWALILGLDRPDLYAGVVALSAVTYPEPIGAAIARGAAKRIPLCILRGDRDHMFPQRLQQELRTGATIMRDNPESLWKLLPNTTHADVWDHAAICYRRIATMRRE